MISRLIREVVDDLNPIGVSDLVTSALCLFKTPKNICIQRNDDIENKKSIAVRYSNSKAMHFYNV